MSNSRGQITNQQQRPVPGEFVRQELTSCSGLELLRGYLRPIDLPYRLRGAYAATGSDGRLRLLTARRCAYAIYAPALHRLAA